MIIISTILQILHAVSCLALMAVALHWKLTNPDPERRGAHRRLFPFIIAASLMACAVLVLSVVEITAAYYSGSLYEVGESKAVAVKSLRLIFVAYTFLLLLPVTGLAPPIGKRPVLMSAIAVVGLLPSVFDWWMQSL
ncbi:MAG: hypothetical protein EOP85_20490 [Verrucomicrobiaceae bacterium]|nr:MAG: hypothetical protein EOP85_20490 [Verrucomicrobiaceae bacterium]